MFSAGPIEHNMTLLNKLAAVELFTCEVTNYLDITQNDPKI